MTATKVGIVYSVALRRVCQVWHFDSDDEGRPNFPSGWAYVEQPLADFLARGPHAFIQDLTGGPALSARCAVLDDTNTVIDHHEAEPSVVNVTGKTLIPSTISKIGDVYQSGRFMRPFAQVSVAGIVTAVVMADAESPPAPVNAGGVVIEAQGAKQGDAPPGLAARIAEAAVLGASS